jgi:hypothetical protein
MIELFLLCAKTGEGKSHTSKMQKKVTYNYYYYYFKRFLKNYEWYNKRTKSGENNFRNENYCLRGTRGRSKQEIATAIPNRLCPPFVE